MPRCASLRPLLTMVVFFTFLAACGNAAESNDNAVNEQAEANSPSSEEISTSETLPIGISVISYEPEFYVNLLAELFKARGEGSCNIAVSEVIETRGDFVELSIDDSGPVSQARLVASANNGSELPCSMEAIFEEVPANAPSYTVRQSGGDEEGRAQAVSGEDLKRDGYKMIIYPRIDPKILSQN
jgi:hypothetical protein